MKAHKLLPIVILISFTLACLPFSYASAHGQWDANEVDFEYDDLTTIFVIGVFNAYLTWNNAGADFSFTLDSGSENFWYLDYVEGEPLAEAYHVHYLGYITHCDAYFNTYWDWDYLGDEDKYDSITVATHEFGHWLWLAEDYTNSDSVMYYETDPGELRRILDQDDIDDIIALYGES